MLTQSTARLGFETFLLQLPDAAVAQCATLQRIQVPDSRVLYWQGEVCTQVFWVISGIVKRSHVTDAGDEFTLAFLSRGAVFGCLPTPEIVSPMDETATAVRDVSIYLVQYAEFRSWLLAQPEAAWQFLEAVSVQRQRAEQKLRRLLTQNVELRVIAMLKELVGMLGTRCSHGYALELRLTQQELADLVGASRPVVSTVMNDLKKRGWLDYTRVLICLHDRMFNNKDRAVL